ncbi:PREDICTED: coiled-coil domain-containing protein 61 [Colobus angolensis palliatus]|uniref:Centrosomal protein CCDC61 n=1 Tax=Colobus angolensis palliatus TaxID=336983 RepID=A0A2K5HA01_COLAP|nr:PREDICTED: coiled-coil domain-containing protein 61 [Colobus angolensis palliatus]
MDQPAGLQVDYVFRGVEHAVRVMVSGQVLELEVEDRMTADQWRGEFDAGFIEDLTHKTGNFKQFNIFCHMLESALTQSSESVTLDLLTYTDLESLRNRKIGGRPGPLAPRSAQLNSKRYLILIYSVEFDRIHYPLPLPYQGKPDPVVLQGIIRSLKEELGRLQGLDGQNTRDTRESEIWHLREQQQQRNRLGSGGSGDGPSVSWSRQTRPPAVVTGRGDAPNRSRNRSSSVDSFRSRCSSASSCSDLEDFSESFSRGGHRRRGKPPGPTPWSGSNTRSTPVERSHHQKSLANSGGWVPIKEYSSDHQAADMAEIDARLKALQEYMNRLDMRS